jgi:hypothetical protein
MTSPEDNRGIAVEADMKCNDGEDTGIPVEADIKVKDGEDSSASGLASGSEDDHKSVSSPSSTGTQSLTTSRDGTTAVGFNAEDRRISGARCFLLFVLLVAAATLGTIAYLSTANEEQTDFEAHVSGLSLLLSESTLQFGTSHILALAFIATSNPDQKHCQFFNTAEEVIGASNSNVRKVFAALESLSVTTTGFIVQQRRSNNGAYPPSFVTVPQTERHLRNAR